MEGTRTIANWEDEVGVADAGYVRCGYLLTVPERLEAACRDNVARAAGARPADALPRRRARSARSSRSCRSTESRARRTSPRAGSPTRRRCAWAGSPPPPSRGLAHRLGCTVSRAAGRGRAGHRRRDRPRFTAAGRSCSRLGAWANDLLRAARRRAADRAAPAPGARRPPRARRAAALGGLLGRRLERGRAPRPRPPLLRGRLRGARIRSTRADDCDHAASPGYADVVRAARSASATRAWPTSRSNAPSPAPTTSRPTGTRSSARAPGSRASTWPSAGAGTASSSRPPSARWLRPRSPDRQPPIDVRPCAPSASPRAACCAWPMGQARGRSL